MRKRLTSIRGFFPYISVVLINAIIDLGHKIVIQNTVFKCYSGPTQVALTALVNACILLPFILFFTPAGFLADRFSKHKIIRWTVGMGIPITALIYLSYLLGWFEAAFGLTLILAGHSAFYSPAKYGYIKEMVGKENLGMANGVVQAVTIVAILLGGVLFSIAFESLIGNAITKHEILQAIAPCGILLFTGAICQTILCLRIPQYKQGDTRLRLDLRTYLAGTYLRQNLKNLRKNEIIWLSVMGLAIFWAVNQVLFAAFGAHLKDMAGVTSTIVAQGLLAIGGVGIIAGSFTAGRLSRTYIETGIIPLGALGMTICLVLIPNIAHTATLGALLAIYGFFGGLFIVPLNALIQFNAKDDDLGTILAGNNFLQNVGMLTFLCGTVVASFFGVGSVPILYTLAAIVTIGSVYTLRTLPQSLMRFLLRALFSQRYRLSVSGLQHIPSQGGVLLLGNHTSWIDWAVLLLAVPRPVRFVMARKYYDRWFLRWFLDFYRVIPISSTASSSALRKIIEALNAGECVALFPEGAISRNGQLGPFRRGFSIPATQTGSPIIPFYLRGLWGSRWSMVSRHFRQNTRERVRSVNLCFGQPLPAESTALDVKYAVHRLSIQAWQEYSATLPPLPQALIKALKRTPTRLAAADAFGNELTCAQLFAQATRLSKKLETTAPCVGILLPPGPAACIANLAVLMAGKTLVNLPPDPQNFASAVQQTNLDTLITGANIPEPLQNIQLPANIIRLDAHPDQQKNNVLHQILFRILPARMLGWIFIGKAAAADTAAIIFANRNQPDPTGIRLTHTNIITNTRQVSSLFPPKGDDVALAILPLHQALGLTMSLFLPLLESVPMICHHNAHERRTIGKLCTDYDVTLFCATPDILTSFASDERLHPLMFESLRFVVSGNKALGQEQFQAFRDKFGLPIYEGYGVTETSPVVTVNAPDAMNPLDLSIQQGRKSGTVGLPLPGSAIRIVDPENGQDLAQGETGKILIGGTQIAAGYLGTDAYDKLIREEDGIRWFVTNDYGRLDEDGFLIIAPERTPHCVE